MGGYQKVKRSKILNYASWFFPFLFAHTQTHSIIIKNAFEFFVKGVFLYNSFTIRCYKWYTVIERWYYGTDIKPAEGKVIAFTFDDGPSYTKSTEKILDKLEELGMKAIAITDHGVMYGAIEFYKECIKNDIKPLLFAIFLMFFNKKSLSFSKIWMLSFEIFSFWYIMFAFYIFFKL